MPLKLVDIPTLHAQMGLTPGTAVRLGWARDWLASIEGRVRAANGVPLGQALTPADEARVQREVDSTILTNFEAVRAYYDDELTEVEQLREDVVAASQLRAALQRLRQADGTLVPDADARLKALGF